MNLAAQLQSQKKKPVIYGNDNVLESLRGIGTSVGKTVVKDVLAQGGNDVLSSIFGSLPKSGELKQNQYIEFSKNTEKAPQAQPRKAETFQTVSRMDEMEVRKKIDAIRAELKALSQSIKGLRQEISKTVLIAPVDPGIYHLNFFEHLKSYLHIMKEQVDDSRTWLSAGNSRKAKKGFWGQYKKHGTSFGLSNERSIATSAG
jgi:hypothetical protein